MSAINNQTTLGAIVAKHPGTIAVMNKYKLDYCCGGKDTLEIAVRDLKLNENTVLSELQAVSMIQENEGKEVKNWKEESITRIANYILDNHHVFMKDTMKEINTLMFKILKVHFTTNGESLLVIHSLFGSLKTELEAHLVKEEENLFPMIFEYDTDPNVELKETIRKYIKETEDEHDAAGDLFKKIAKATNDYTPPQDACFSYRRTFELLDALEKDTFNHIHMENSILFEMI